jgi:excisionase family DNA binding protein
VASNPAAYLSPPAVARRLGVKPEKIIGWIRAGELRAADLAQRRGGRPRYRVNETDLEAFLARRSVTPLPRTRRRARKSEAVTAYF